MGDCRCYYKGLCGGIMYGEAYGNTMLGKHVSYRACRGACMRTIWEIHIEGTMWGDNVGGGHVVGTKLGIPCGGIMCGDHVVQSCGGVM